jgi:RecJ-like exonuclease
MRIVEDGIQMSELYLVAHKANGAATFDVAVRQPCPHCNPAGVVDVGCDECDGTGYWWITSTGGWRVYPWWFQALSELYCNTQEETPLDFAKYMPPESRELYNPLATRETKLTKQSSADGKALLATLGISVQPAVSGTLKRRI